MVESLLNTGEALGSIPSTARRKRSYAAVDYVGVPTSNDKCPMETQSEKVGCSSKIAISRLAWARVRPLLHTRGGGGGAGGLRKGCVEALRNM